jgi:hypothetical protein
MSLALFQSVVGVELMLEDTFSDEDVGANGARDKIPGVVDNQDSKFFFHDAAPVRIGEGSADGGGTGDKADTEVADRVSLSAGSWKSRFTHVVIS